LVHLPLFPLPLSRTPAALGLPPMPGTEDRPFPPGKTLPPIFFFSSFLTQSHWALFFKLVSRWQTSFPFLGPSISFSLLFFFWGSEYPFFPPPSSPCCGRIRLFEVKLSFTPPPPSPFRSDRTNTSPQTMKGPSLPSPYGPCSELLSSSPPTTARKALSPFFFPFPSLSAGSSRWSLTWSRTPFFFRPVQFVSLEQTAFPLSLVCLERNGPLFFFPPVHQEPTSPPRASIGPGKEEKEPPFPHVTDENASPFFFFPFFPRPERSLLLQNDFLPETRLLLLLFRPPLFFPPSLFLWADPGRTTMDHFFSFFSVRRIILVPSPLFSREVKSIFFFCHAGFGVSGNPPPCRQKSLFAFPFPPPKGCLRHLLAPLFSQRRRSPLPLRRNTPPPTP